MFAMRLNHSNPEDRYQPNNIVEAEKQPLLDNGPYTRSRGMRHVRCYVAQELNRCCKLRSLWTCTALVAKQLLGKHIPAATNKQATIEAPIPKQRIGKHTSIGVLLEMVFSVRSVQSGYNEEFS
jgi:hypothetical protein